MCVTIPGDKPTLRQLNCLRYTDKNGEECKIHIIDSVAAHWRRLGLALNFELCDLNNIKHNNTMCRTVVRSCWVDGCKDLLEVENQ